MLAYAQLGCARGLVKSVKVCATHAILFAAAECPATNIKCCRVKKRVIPFDRAILSIRCSASSSVPAAMFIHVVVVL